jgi:hypothetical protein
MKFWRARSSPRSFRKTTGHACTSAQLQNCSISVSWWWIRSSRSYRRSTSISLSIKYTLRFCWQVLWWHCSQIFWASQKPPTWWACSFWMVKSSWCRWYSMCIRKNRIISSKSKTNSKYKHIWVSKYTKRHSRKVCFIQSEIILTILTSKKYCTIF